MSQHRLFAPNEIEARSLEIIARLLPDMDHASAQWPVVRRIVHAAGDPSIAHITRVHPRAVESGVQGILSGRPILTDTRMLAAGISRRLASGFGCEILCAIDDPAVPDLARDLQTTRSAAAVHRLLPMVPNSIVAIGNAPTALFALLDALEKGLSPPALIVATPVGFVGAAESKAQLVARVPPFAPYITVEGNRGGSAMAVAAVNALLGLAALGGLPANRYSRDPSEHGEGRQGS